MKTTGRRGWIDRVCEGWDGLWARGGKQLRVLSALALPLILVGCGAGGSAPSDTSPYIYIVAQPQSQSATLGDMVTFSVTATGARQLSYQWYDNGQPIQGANQSSYTIAQTSGTLNDQHQYWVVVNNTANHTGATSQAATLRVYPVPGIELLAGGLGGAGSVDGPGVVARFSSPSDVAVDSAGNIYVADSSSTIRKITPAGVVSTLAGTPVKTGSADGTGSAALFNNPAGVAVDSTGNVYVADTANGTIRKITPTGVVTTLAGTAGQFGYADGKGGAAVFADPCGVAVDSAGNVYVADSFNNIIRKITPGGVVTTLAGTAVLVGSADGTGAAARFKSPSGVTVDSAGNVYVADAGNNTIRKITPAGVVTTLAGTAGQAGSVDGAGTMALFKSPSRIAVDSAGNLYVADTDNNSIRKITAAGVVSTLAGTAGQTGSTDGTGKAALFNVPVGVAVDSAGNVYVADETNDSIRKITPTGGVITLAGAAGHVGSADGTGSAALFNNPAGVAMDSAGNIYVVDGSNHTIRKITLAGIVTTLAGAAGQTGSADGPGTTARFNGPSGVATDSAGNVYVADTGNSTIRKITPAGIVSTLAGKAGGFGNEDGTGTAVAFRNPSGVAVDSAGNVYVTDTGNHTIRKITPDGVVSTLPLRAPNPDGANSTAAALLNRPGSVAADLAGNIYVVNAGNQAIVKITPDGVVTTLAGANRFVNFGMLTVDSVGNVYVADSGASCILKITQAGVVTTVAGTVGQFGVSLGRLPGTLNWPTGIALQQDFSGVKLYVSNASENNIVSISLGQ